MTKHTPSVDTIFDKPIADQLDAMTSEMRKYKDQLSKMYWDAHKKIAETSYNHSSDQQRDMVTLGTLAKCLKDLSQVIGDTYCLSITAGKSQ